MVLPLRPALARPLVLRAPAVRRAVTGADAHFLRTRHVSGTANKALYLVHLTLNGVGFL